jgi:hypothetical protein
MANHLLPSEYPYLTVDIQWCEPESNGHVYDPDAEPTVDAYGRLTPGLKKVLSAAHDNGFKTLADYVHSKGLKFGIHIMRGIPKQAARLNTPVLNTTSTAKQIALTQSTGPCNPAMLEVNQHSAGKRQVSRQDNLIVWTAQSTRSRDHYLALFNPQSCSDNLNSAAADDASHVLAGNGSSQAIQIRINDAKRLILFIQDGGDGFSNDHAARLTPYPQAPTATSTLPI